MLKPDISIKFRPVVRLVPDEGPVYLADLGLFDRMLLIVKGTHSAVAAAGAALDRLLRPDQRALILTQDVQLYSLDEEKAYVMSFPDETSDADFELIKQQIREHFGNRSRPIMIVRESDVEVRVDPLAPPPISEVKAKMLALLNEPIITLDMWGEILFPIYNYVTNEEYEKAVGPGWVHDRRPTEQENSNESRYALLRLLELPQFQEVEP